MGKIIDPKVCDQCKHFSWVSRAMAAYEQGDPSCSHPDGWRGVEVDAIGVPLNIGWARGDGASCGPDALNWEAK